jgi:hypothetical protein
MIIFVFIMSAGKTTPFRAWMKGGGERSGASRKVFKPASR